jgi:hypothetical protein
MSITKPFTFVAGTKARANEVNQNFDVLYSQVNSNISAINTNANDIDTLDSNKANVNGSSSQRFACADPTSTSDAVNKQSLTKAIWNSINYIDGYVISKDSGSPNDTILVTAGSCYDSTKTIVLAKDTSTTKQNISQGASTTYYVYVIGNGSGSSVDILISSSAVTPALPEGYTKFRQIGYYTTGVDGYINSIHNSSNSSTFDYAPDYDRAISVSYSSGDVVNFDGWLAIDGSVSGLALTGWVAINGIKFCTNYRGNQDGGGATFAGITMVRATDVITMQYFSGTIYKIPFVGGNA